MTRYPDMASPDMDVEKVRAQFPILSRKVHDSRPLIYLDNAATTQKPQCVIDAVSDYYLHFNANVHRSVHWLGAEATRRFEDSRQRIAAFIGSKSEQSVVFTRGTTESINLVAHAWGRKNIGAGDEILLTEMEHHSNLIPWQLLAEEKGARLKVVPVMRDGELDQAEYERLLSKRVKLAAFTHVSNVLGTVNPVREMVAKAGAVGALTLIDAAQSAPHIWIDVEDLDCDFLAFSGHKMYGPTGVGVLYGREEVLWEMDPFMCGGEMIASVQLDHSTWADPPQRFEAGTPDIAGAIGLAAAVEFIENLGLERISGYETRLTQSTIARLKRIDGVRIAGGGGTSRRGAAISFVVEGIHPHDLAQFVDAAGIAIRAGHMCAQPLLRKLDAHALCRVSPCIYNSAEEIERLAEAIEAAKEYF